jgi:hypothetical protein
MQCFAGDIAIIAENKKDLPLMSLSRGLRNVQCLNEGLAPSQSRIPRPKPLGDSPSLRGAYGLKQSIHSAI